jgi:hypothetical protein
MHRSQEGRVEELSRLVGGRFKLTTLIQKQAREYYRGGRAFMPSVRNMDELFNFILSEIEEGKIALELYEGKERQVKLYAAVDDEELAQIEADENRPEPTTPSDIFNDEQ